MHWECLWIYVFPISVFSKFTGYPSSKILLLNTPTKWCCQKKESTLGWNFQCLSSSPQYSFSLIGRCHSNMYLINRMPSSILNNQFPHSLLYQHKIFTPFLFVSLVAYALSMTLLQVKINFLSNHSNMFSLVTHPFRRAIIFCPRLQCYIVSTNVTFFWDYLLLHFHYIGCQSYSRTFRSLVNSGLGDCFSLTSFAWIPQIGSNSNRPSANIISCSNCPSSHASCTWTSSYDTKRYSFLSYMFS